MRSAVRGTGRVSGRLFPAMVGSSPLLFSGSKRHMAVTKGHPRNPGEGGGFFGLNPPPRTQTDAEKFDTFHAGHKISSPLSLQGDMNPASPAFNAAVWSERYPGRYDGGIIPKFATVHPELLGQKEVGVCENLVAGRWIRGSKGQVEQIPDPLTGQPMLEIFEITETDLKLCVDSFSSCPKYGLHNPILNVHRYLDYGAISLKAATLMAQPEVEHFFARLIQRVSPKSYGQALGEVTVTRKFLENFTGDNVRFLARSFGVPGDHEGQYTSGFRYPYGPVAIIAPFNFPLEIPVLQLMGALYMGNRPVLKVDSKVSVVMDQFLRLLHTCGMPLEDVDFVNCSGEVMEQLLLQGQPRTTLFTGSSRVANRLAVALKGKVRLEGGGFDWKILGPDVPDSEYSVEYVAHVNDQDAHACSGQKCSAQSMLFVHRNWADHTPLYDKMRDLAAKRSLKDLTVGPTLTVTSERLRAHVAALLEIPGAELLYGGEEINGGDHTIPKRYGAFVPTAVKVPLKEIMASKERFHLVTTEVFAPFQIVTEYDDASFSLMLDCVEKIDEHLTAAIVSNDLVFQRAVLSRSVNGTTYVGIRARTTGAPQNHWFGPAGDPRAAGIGTREAIQVTWSCHREIIADNQPISSTWQVPARS
jgi:1-pyrroline-5-carboxylate dehydrogenase